MRYILFCAPALLLAGCAASSITAPSPGGPADALAGESTPPTLTRLSIAAPAAVPAAASQYACPMHPAVVQDHPGKCPICGMTLEPKAGAK